MARYTISIDTRIETLLNNYMKENNIALKSVAIKKCIEEATNKDDLRMILTDIDKKINRLLHRENIDKKLLEQLFCNMGFPINEKIKDDICLKEFYKINEEYSKKILERLDQLSVNTTIEEQGFYTNGLEDMIDKYIKAEIKTMYPRLGIGENDG